ncbi:MAG: transporter [Nocardioidaceae bacterium]|nr:transporter [Nocardioidaceae bacterium]
MTPPLAITGATINLGGRPVVQQVDLVAAAGEFVALLGTNGSGKSTLVRAAVGLIPLTAGEVQLFGTRLAKFHDWERIGYVPQRSTAVAGVPSTVFEVVMSGRLARRRFFGWKTAEDVAAVREALERIGLEDRTRDSVADLSGGQQQRILIARALAAQSELLIMDEPTAGVDHDSQDALAHTLKTLSDEGVTIVLVAHELGPLAPLIDRAVVLRAGHVVFEGPVDGAWDFPHSHEHPHSGEPSRTDGLSGEGMWR